MIIIGGTIDVDPSDRERYIAGRSGVMEQARSAPGCHAFSLSPDPVVPGRINVFERWDDDACVEAFRTSGEELADGGIEVVGASVAKYRISATEAP